MAQSLASLHVHLVFSTKDRQSWLTDAIRTDLHSYLAAILQAQNCHVVLINSVEDHVHLLFGLARTASVSEVVEELKKRSSKWIKTIHPDFKGFAWQGGYGAFAVSVSHLDLVRDYIATQREHHRKKTFQDEFRAFLKRNRIQFDERYVWD